MPDTVFARGARRTLRRGAVLAALVCAASLALAQQQAQTAQQAIRPNFRDADITSIIDAVAMTTGRSFIVDPRVRAQVTMYSNATMTPGQFYQAFLAILQVHGFVAVPSGNVIKIIPDANMRQMPGNDLPEHVNPTSDEIVTQVLAVKNVSAATLVPILRPLQSTNGQISAVTGANMLIISDHAANVSRLERIIGRIDQVGSADVDVISLQSATAADTARVLNSLMTQSGDTGTAIKIVADDRSNSILVSGDANQRLRLRTLIANLDTPVDSGSETQVRYLRYAAAEDLATKLKEQLSGNTGTTSQAGRNQTAVAQPQPNGQGNTGPLPGAPAAGAPASTGAATISLAGGTATIWADKDTNAIVITAAQRTMRAVNAVIDKLDIRRPQVAIEALIVEVSADKTADLGVNWALDASATNVGVGGFISPIGGSSIVDLYSAVKGVQSGTATASPPTGTTVGVGRLQATGVNFAAILRAVAGDSRTNILQHPQVVTRDNQEAKMEVAQEVPFLTGQYTTTNGTGSAFQTIQRQEVGTILTVTPQINEGDAVLLKIQIESSSLAGSSGVTAVDLITNKRTISTSVLIKDGGTLVLGGLISDTATNTEQRVPGLGRIPIIGELFRTRDTSKNKSDLLIFIQPRILRDDAQAVIETDAKYQYLRQEQRDLNRENTVIPAQPFQKTPILPADIKDAPIAPTINASPIDGDRPNGVKPGSAPPDSPAPGDSTPPSDAGAGGKSP
jgi:general secretion pathway protein D